jgi:HEAT repeat protein
LSKARLGRIVLGVVGATVGVVAVLLLREATLSTHEPVSARQTDLLMSAKTKGGEENQTLSEMVQAQLLTCRLEVQSDLAAPIERRGDGRYRAVLVPALDDTNKRQFRGCLEDWTIDHVQIDVVHLTDIR